MNSNNTNKKEKQQKKAIPSKTQTPKETAEELAELLFIVAKLTDEGTVDYVYETLLEDPFDEDTREFVRGILMEALSSQFDVEGTVVCGSLFALLGDIDK